MRNKPASRQKTTYAGIAAIIITIVGYVTGNTDLIVKSIPGVMGILGIFLRQGMKD